MGYFWMIAPCIGCHQPFAFHPHKVPSIFVNGDKHPICQQCVDRVNPARIKNGLEPIVPLPGAYEPADETDWIEDLD
jgi:hypothetical protein